MLAQGPANCQASGRLSQDWVASLMARQARGIEFTAIVPTYNRRHMLWRALNSIYAQTFQPAEIIVADDGSTDGTVDWLRQRHPRVSLVSLTSNSGPAAAINAALARVRAPIVAFLDDDDEWLPVYLEKVSTAWRRNRKASLVYSDYILVEGGEDGRRRSAEVRVKPAHTDPIAAMLIENFVHTVSLMSARTDLLRAIGGANEAMRVAFDRDLNLRLLKRGAPVHLAEPLVRRHRHGVCLSLQRAAWRRNVSKTLDGFVAVEENHRYRAFITKAKKNLDRIVERRNGRMDPRFGGLSSTAAIAEHLEGCLADIGDCGRYVLLEVPTHGSPATCMARLGIDSMLRQRGARSCHVATVATVRWQDVAASPKDAPILLVGGAGLGDAQPADQAFREEVIRRFPERRIVILPLPIMFSDAASAFRASEVVRGHGHVVVFASDEVSFHCGRYHFGRERMRLAPPLGFALANPMGILGDWLGTTSRRRLFIGDRVLARPSKTGRQGRWPDHFQSDEPGALEFVRNAAQLTRMWHVLTEPSLQRAWAEIAMGARMLAEAGEVVTDRLPIHLLGALLEKRSTLLTDGTHGNTSFHWTWLRALSHCQLDASHKTRG